MNQDEFYSAIIIAPKGANPDLIVAPCCNDIDWPERLGLTSLDTHKFWHLGREREVAFADIEEFINSFRDPCEIPFSVVEPDRTWTDANKGWGFVKRRDYSRRKRRFALLFCNL